MRAMVSSVKDKGVTQPAIVRPREDGGYYKECKGKKKQCRKKFRALIVEPRPSGHRGPKS